MKVPPLPQEVFSVLGPVKVVEKAMKKYLGRWNLKNRVIKVNPTQSPIQQWQTLFHEMVHMALADSGAVNHLEHDMAESVCDAVGTYLAAALMDGCLVVPTGEPAAPQ
jgi:Zn-dependent peptidase ImmA (M78 family)